MRSSTARGLGCRTSRTTPVHQEPVGAPRHPRMAVSVTLVPLFLPRVAPVVVAVALPETLLVVVEQGQPRHPLRALPEVQVRHEQSHGTAVVARERCPV